MVVEGVLFSSVVWRLPVLSIDVEATIFLFFCDGNMLKRIVKSI